MEIVLTIQAFLDARSAALPSRARRALEAKAVESLDDYPSLGFDFDAVDLAALGGDEQAAVIDPIDKKDGEFAQIILNVICPRIYRLLSDMLPAVMDEISIEAQGERQVFINKLTKCWSDLAGIVVIEHQLAVSCASTIVSLHRRTGHRTSAPLASSHGRDWAMNQGVYRSACTSCSTWLVSTQARSAPSRKSSYRCSSRRWPRTV